MMGTAAEILCIAIIVLEVISLLMRLKDLSWSVLAFYTVLSNILTMISCALALEISGLQILRYLSTCMMTMTFLVVVFVLIPLGGSPKELLFSGTGLFHHLLCPVLNFVSYVFFEPHSRLWPVPVAVTFGYGILMLWLNHKGIVDGPYPFFRIRTQKASSTVMWMAALTCLIAVISIAVRWAAK